MDRVPVIASPPALASIVGFIAAIAIAIAIVVAVVVAVVVMARTWHWVGTARGQMDNSIYQQAMVLMPCQSTSWNSAPYFWMLDIIEMIKTATNCRARQCKQTYVCVSFPLALCFLRSSGGRLGPLGLGQQRGPH